MKLVFAKIFRTVFTKILKNYEAINEAKLPFEETNPISSDNFNLCKKKLMNFYSKLKNDPELFKRYNDEILLSKRN